MRIETDSTALTQALLDLVDVMNAAGATFHPGLRIVGASGQISAWADGDEPWLMRIPTSRLVPIEGVTWSGEPPLRIASAPGELTSLQVEVLEACTAVMAAAGTWEHFRSTHPRATVTDPEAIAIIQSLHPAFSPATSAAAMLKTRTIKLAVDDEEPASYLMPMLDLVNHHPEAPAYARDDGCLSIGTWRVAERGECFVSYGSTRDVLGIALAYGYVDETITRANALPGEYEMPGGGTLRLVRASRPEFTHEPGVLTVIGAAFDASDPRVQRATLEEPIERHLRGQGTPALGARHQARVLANRIAQTDSQRIMAAQDALIGLSGARVVRQALNRHMNTLQRSCERRIRT